MRTTLTIDPDVAVKAKKAVQITGLPFKSLINQALRIGIDSVLAPKKSRPYRTQGRNLGLRKGLTYDNIQELLAVAEGENLCTISAYKKSSVSSRSMEHKRVNF